jgi:hypothetical protein
MLHRRTTTTDIPRRDRVGHTAALHHLQATHRLDNINLLHNISLQHNPKAQEDTELNHTAKALTALHHHHKVNMVKLHSSIAHHNTAQHQHQHKEAMDIPLLQMINIVSTAPHSQDPTTHLHHHSSTVNSPLPEALANKDISSKVHQAVTVNKDQGNIHLYLVNTDSHRLADNMDSHHKASKVVNMDNLHNKVVAMVVSSNTNNLTEVVIQVSSRETNITRVKDLLHLDGR